MILSRSTPITELSGIGDVLTQKFLKLGITTVGELLFYTPYKYQDTSDLTTIQDFLEQGSGTFLAEIVEVKTIHTRTRKQITTVKVKDDTQSLSFTYFNQPYISKTLLVGEYYLFNAKVTLKGNKKSIYNPKYEKFKGEKEKQLHLGKMISIYSETKGLSSRIIRTKIKQLEKEIPEIISDPLTKYIQIYNFLELPSAITKIHFPDNKDEIIKARERLAFDEMLKIGFKIETQIKEESKKKGLAIKTDTKTTNQFIKTIPFQLTNDQNQALETILSEINSTKPMNRLLNGDVGSGKTIVAAIAILNTIKAGYSSILIAPTTVLARQHYDTFGKIFKDFGINIEICISSQKNISKEKNKLIIGTHAILYDKDIPNDIGLVVIDEQHRFGVEQRKYFKEILSHSPHYLTMTATPIPRSLTEVFFGNLDVSEIREKPSNRKDIKTYYTPFTKRIKCFEWISNKIIDSQNQEQVFIIYPLIEETEKSVAKSVLNEFEELKEKYFKNLNIAYLHGKLAPKEKEKILEDFRNKKYNILISTTVIEVGIDISDATIMVIENAERFGLAQLHQLRGRVGRGEKQSYCYVIPGQESEEDEKIKERLEYFASHKSGFEVAEYDLQRRGPGEVYGTKQAGIPSFKVASIHDLETLKKAREVARKILKEDNNYDKILEGIFK